MLIIVLASLINVSNHHAIVRCKVYISFVYVLIYKVRWDLEFSKVI